MRTGWARMASPWSAMLLCGLFSTAVQAGQTGQADDKSVFDRLDISGNGYLTGPEIAPEIRHYNTNGDGVVTWEEFVAGRARDRAAGKLPAAPATAPATPTASAAPSPPAAVKLSAMKARPGHVIGRAVYADGRPIPRFQVTAMGWAGEVHLGPTGTLPNLGQVRAQNGQYAIRTTSEFDRSKPVKALVVGVRAIATLTRNGTEYNLEMHPTDGKKDGSGAGSFRGDSGKGVVRDFVLRLYGPKRGYEKNTPPRDTNTNEMSDPSFGAFYGGTVAVSLPRDAAQTMDGSMLTVTFTPAGPLYDGSPGKTIVRTMRLRKPDIYTAYFRDIPLGDYTATATVSGPNGASSPLRLRILGQELNTSAPVIFQPAGIWGISTVTVLSER